MKGEKTMRNLHLGKVSLRKLDLSDKEKIASMANNKNVWDNLTDIMPHPYSEEDAVSFIRMATSSKSNHIFGIEYDGELCGVIGLHSQPDVFRLSAEIGYWLGEDYWHKGIAVYAVRIAVKYGFETLGLERIFASVYDFNTASRRVLEKSGFTFEGRSRKSVIKNNVILDDLRYSIIREDINDDYLKI
jgi:[ribosomal protein S5]-alanine N-acetyltransferase